MKDEDCYLVTYSGIRVNPLAPRREDISIVDMAHSLALSNRFIGHTREPISIAQHSVFVSALVEGRIRTIPGDSFFSPELVGLQGLLHDGSEYLLGDVTKWLKQTDAMAGYREAEDRCQRLIYSLFDLPMTDFPIVQWADKFMVRYEAMMGYDTYPITTEGYEEPSIEEQEKFGKATYRLGPWYPWPWQKAEEVFLNTFARLHPVGGAGKPGAGAAGGRWGAPGAGPGGPGAG